MSKEERNNYSLGVSENFLVSSEGYSWNTTPRSISEVRTRIHKTKSGSSLIAQATTGGAGGGRACFAAN